jgi:hypothetical protein
MYLPTRKSCFLIHKEHHTINPIKWKFICIHSYERHFVYEVEKLEKVGDYSVNFTRN